jgi:tripartite-type tricarboxylate transporter receptor subunit TctC
MILHRRTFLHLAAGAAAVPAFVGGARAQAYPARPVRIVAGQPAGSTTDIVARLIGQWLHERLGQPFVVENRPGAGGTIAAEQVVRSAPDGYTLLLLTTSQSIDATLYENLKYDIVRDIAVVSMIVGVPNVMAINPSVPASTVPEFIAYAKANPGKLNMASAGNGTSSHVAGELFKLMAGVNLVHVPYRGSPAALTGLLGGQVQVCFVPTASSIEHVRAGKLRALAVTTTTPMEALPGVPTVAAFVPGYEASTWAALAAPKDTPAEIIDTLNREIRAAVADPRIKASLADMGGVVLAGSPADGGRFLSEETAKWGKVVKFAGLRAE